MLRYFVVVVFRIAGWNKKLRPTFARALHVGDEVVALNSHKLDDLRTLHTLIGDARDSDVMTFTLKRLPLARALLLVRDRDGQNLGLKRNGGTGEVMILKKS